MSSSAPTAQRATGTRIGLRLSDFVRRPLAERVALAATFVVGFAGSLFMTLGLELQNSPDTTLYTSGVSLFPSPLGTLFGTLFGVEGLALLQAGVIGVTAMAFVALRVPLRSIGLAIPVLIWMAPLSVNVIAAAVFAAGWTYRRAWLGWVAAGFHLACLVLLVVISRARWVAALALAIGCVLVLITPYSAGLRLGDELERIPQAVAAGVFVGALALLPGLVAGVRVWDPLYLALGGAVALGVAYAVRFDLSDGYVVWTSVPQTFRYALPVVFVCFVEAARLRAPAPERAVDESALLARSR